MWLNTLYVLKVEVSCFSDRPYQRCEIKGRKMTQNFGISLKKEVAKKLKRGKVQQEKLVFIFISGKREESIH